MDDVSQLVGNVMVILTVLIGVMKLIAVSMQTFIIFHSLIDAKVNKSLPIVFPIKTVHIINFSSIIFYNQIALSTNLNVQMDNASQLVGNVMAILTVSIEATKLIVVSL